MDEMGINTNQKEDGHVGGELFLCEIGTRPKIAVSTMDHCCTIIPIVATSGEAVCCVVIFQGDSKSPMSDWCLGIDITMPPVKDENGEIIFDECNIGKGKYRPGGPTCKFHGKELTCMFFISQSGGVNAEILVKILSNLDEQEVFDCSQGQTPMIILDGHDSWLKPLFLNYINNPRTKWKVCLGTPYGTSYWQVGDAPEQNGSFKMAWYRAKQQ